MIKNMDIFGFQFSLIIIVLLSLLVFAFAIQLYYYIRYYNNVIRHTKRINRGKVDFLDEKPGVSIIIAAKNESTNLQQFLPFVLEQDYPNYEVIVVDDASDDESDNVISQMMSKYAHLHTSFVPKGAKNLSTKKLALSIGIKAAKNDILLFTDADCMPYDKNWVSNMVRNFTADTDYVLGYGGYIKRKGFINKLIKFDTLFIAIQYFGMAISKKPYMGVGRNLAYKKEAFYRNKGFASILQFRSGDDDLLINKFAKGHNTRVEISKEGSTWSEPNSTFKQWYKQKERHLSVSENYSQTSKFLIFWEVFFRGVFYVSLISLIVFAAIQQNWIALVIAISLFITRYIIQLNTINQTSKILGDQKFYFSLILFDILLPLISLFLLIFGKKGRAITWK